MNQLEIERQFKKDFGMTLDEATRKHNQNKKNSDEIYALKMALNGVDVVTGGKINMSETNKVRAKLRLKELTGIDY